MLVAAAVPAVAVPAVAAVVVRAEAVVVGVAVAVEEAAVGVVVGEPDAEVRVAEVKAAADRAVVLLVAGRAALQAEVDVMEGETADAGDAMAVGAPSGRASSSRTSLP